MRQAISDTVVLVMPPDELFNTNPNNCLILLFKNTKTNDVDHRVNLTSDEVSAMYQIITYWIEQGMSDALIAEQQERDSSILSGNHD